ncbi:hypothetical protein K9N68_08035 [Kovacikia minuta CCNUW1]|uniref:hypothetical protein n=1 Tax=Kovacikia minuta TaxID=2931930 RepID=UPI001CCDA14C|nr:hypothetical protein [Kovacikia minuta]UBF27842.1 hypothetical protein K9N68_08035 [Kovacikia minuta CCNUW1]
MADKKIDRSIDNDQRVGEDSYDRGIIPAETAARMEREGTEYKHTPHNEETLDTEGGYTVDKEGLLNNYAVEPEMYYEVPGDAREQEKAVYAERAEELDEVNETDETGKLTSDQDNRNKGTGVI